MVVIHSNRVDQMVADRYSRQKKIKWFRQDRVSKVKAVVVGCGALGSEVAKNLAFLGVRSIYLVDMDKVEEHNLNRQLFMEKQIGMPKSKALAENIIALNSKIEVRNVNAKAEALVDDYDFNSADWYFDCLDNIPTRKFLNSFCVTKGKKMIHGGTNPDNAEVQVIIPKKTACMGCIPYAEEVKVTKQNCADFAAAICTTNGITACLMVDAFMNYLFDLPNKMPWISYIRNKGAFYRKVERKKGCEVCSQWEE